MKVDDSAPRGTPVDETAALLESVLSCPFEAERDALWARGLAEARESLLDFAVDRLLRDPPSDGWLAERVADELGPAAPGRLLRRASGAGFSSNPDRTASAVRFLFRKAAPGAALQTARSLDSADVATAFVAAAAAGTFAPDGETPSSLLAALGASPSPSAVGRLCTRPEPALRRAAAQALALLPPGDALPPLEILAADVEPSVRSACYWAARLLSLTDPGASQLLAVAIHVEDDPDLRTLLDGLLSAAPLPPVLVADVVRSIATIDGPSDPEALRLLSRRADEIPDAALEELMDVACALLVVSRATGFPDLDRRLRSVVSILRHASLDPPDSRAPAESWRAFLTSAFLAIARSPGEDPLVLEAEIDGALEIARDEPFLTEDVRKWVRELSRKSLTPSRLEELAAAFGRSDPVLGARLALAALVASGEPIGASGRTAPDDTAGRPLHLRLRALSPLSSPRRALALSLGGRSLTGGVGGLAALLAEALLGDPRASSDLRSRLAAGEADRHDLFFLGAVFVLPAPTVGSFLDELRQSGRGHVADRLPSRPISTDRAGAPLPA